MSTATAALGTTLKRGDQTSVTTATGEFVDDLLDSAAHGLAIGDLFRFSSLTGGSGLAIETDYYIIAAGFTTELFAFSTTASGSAIDFVSDITACAYYAVGAAIAQVQDVTGPALSTDTDEITNHDSVGGVEEFIPTIKRTGEITFPLVFIPTNATHDSTTGIISAWEDKGLDEFELRYPDGSGWDFAGYTTGFSQTAAVAGHVAADVTIRPSGAPAYVSGA